MSSAGWKNERWAKIFLAGAVCLLLASLFLPYWSILIKAPQYPKGLSLQVYVNRVEGDVQEIDNLNHYIGMRSLKEGAQMERKIAVSGVVAMIFCLALAVRFPRRKMLWLLAPALVFPFAFAGDLYYWLREFGLNLDPHAPLSSSVKPFIPPLFGPGKIAQFHAVARFALGFHLVLSASLLTAGVFFLRMTGSKKNDSAPAKWAWVFLPFFLLGLPAAEARTIQVGDSGEFQTLQSAIAAASDGDRLLVEGGTYEGPVKIDKSLRLNGRGFPVIDGKGKGTVVEISAAGVHVSGFRIRQSGSLLSQEDSGLLVRAPGAVIERNLFEDILFGIYLRNAAGSVLRGNRLTGKDLDLARRGDLIRVWYSDRVTLEQNITRRGRDVVLWFSKNLAVLENDFQEGRYGLHLMYCHEAAVKRNRLSRNSVGAFLMYSSHLHLEHNQVAQNRQASGFGIGFKDVDQASLDGNLVSGNRIGLFFDNSVGVHERNLLAFNDVGIQILPSARNNLFSENSFIENSQQVLIEGQGTGSLNRWQGNYWSDYRGFDLDRDGRGDLPYESVKLFEQVTDSSPSLKIFSGSPATQAIDLASRLFPIFKPQPKFSDPQPRMRVVLPPVGSPGRDFSWPWALLSGTFLIFPLGLSLLTPPFLLSHKEEVKVRVREKSLIKVSGLTKRFGKFTAVERLDFTVQKGETVVLWGTNGAGKTTILRCLLGILPCEGRLAVNGLEVSRQGREVRSQVGYVSQEIRLHTDQSVWDTVCFYSRLRRVSGARGEALLREWHLEEFKDKPVGGLSGGMKQKLGLILALLSDPEILFLDEANSNLDVQSRKELMAQLRDFKKAGKTVLICSHRTGEIWKLADRVVVLEKGRKIAEGRPEEVSGHLTEELLLTMVVGEADCRRAAALIREKGFSAQHNGTEIWVRVPAERKTEPIQTLIAQSIPVIDFEWESGHAS